MSAARMESVLNQLDALISVADKALGHAGTGTGTTTTSGGHTHTASCKGEIDAVTVVVTEVFFKASAPEAVFPRLLVELKRVPELASFGLEPGEGANGRRFALLPRHNATLCHMSLDTLQRALHPLYIKGVVEQFDVSTWEEAPGEQTTVVAESAGGQVGAFAEAASISDRDHEYDARDLIEVEVTDLIAEQRGHGFEALLVEMHKWPALVPFEVEQGPFKAFYLVPHDPNTNNFQAQRAEIERALNALKVAGTLRRFTIAKWKDISPVRDFDPADAGINAHFQTTDNPMWHFHTINLDPEKVKLTGKGVTIAHPDDGWRFHPEMGNAQIDMKRQIDYVSEDKWAGVSDDTGGGQHGIATASVIVSAPNKHHVGRNMTPVTGIAPGAMLVPIRVTAPSLGGAVPSPILLSTFRLAKALRYAAKENMDIASMSIAGPRSDANLHEAVKEARAAGMILIAAASNFTGFIDMYPAAYKEVISVAACNIKKKPWFFTAYGDHVNIIAPGESVWCASFTTKNEPITHRAPGTSFSTAVTAGVAALWLEKWGGRERMKSALREQGHQTFEAIHDEFFNALANKATDMGRYYGKGLYDCEKVFAYVPSFFRQR